ncbi:MAG TPA: SGNH/GDSL hydrolase family protein [Marmoricola sp.]
MPRRRLIAALACVVLAASVSTALVSRAGAGTSRCDRFRQAAAEPARTSFDGTASTRRILVIGDSYSMGLGVRSDQSWAHRLPGRVVVDGFSGSGFSAHASPCGAVSYAARAARGLRRAAPVDLVVVEGGLNDFDQSDGAIRRGFDELIDQLPGARVVVVGPADAPARAAEVPRVDDLLARLSAAHGLRYVRMAGTTFPYLSDGLHLTAAGHREFGDIVSRAIGGRRDS